MLFKLILLFCTMPLLELYLLFGIGSRVGFLPTVLLACGETASMRWRTRMGIRGRSSGRSRSLYSAR